MSQSVFWLTGVVLSSVAITALIASEISLRQRAVRARIKRLRLHR